MKIDLCKYSDLFGKPNTGLHRYRFLGEIFDGGTSTVFDVNRQGIAIVDVIATIILGFFIKFYFLKNTNITTITFFLFILGIFAHRIFCVKTKIDTVIFKN